VYDVLERSFHLFLGIEQVNLDFESEEDMIRKFQVGLALQPVSV
jgi:gamma-glutamylcysteine synthetase